MIETADRFRIFAMTSASYVFNFLFTGEAATMRRRNGFRSPSRRQRRKRRKRRKRSNSNPEIKIRSGRKEKWKEKFDSRSFKRKLRRWKRCRPSEVFSLLWESQLFPISALPIPVSLPLPPPFRTGHFQARRKYFD